MMKSKGLENSSWPWISGYCFYCNVDSTELRNFLITVIGGLVLSSICVCVGVYLRGSFKNVEAIKGKVLEIESVMDSEQEKKE
jgi:hypothetical protein